ncbi:response regulator transcription factor [Serpentinimonas barnesii]|uniref:response regulator transcription factor n=1 Tax=Serpentinimonas barnesii TaxID=1458427 RepID=UPI0004955ADE|nr:response regulator transcription factor [Serpentinimonas barnesii]
MNALDPPLHLLLVEDNDDLRAALSEALAAQGHHVCSLDCAEALPESSTLSRFDIAVLDLNLPGESGLSLAARLRAVQPGIGIVMLTARNSSPDVCRGYASGADIYLAKPVPMIELMAALTALARRLRLHDPDASTLQLQPQAMRLLGAGGAADLSASETKLLCAFARAPQQQLENWQIADLLGMALDSYNKAALELHMVRLRKKLQQAGTEPTSLKAVRGIGYKLGLRLLLV